MSEDWWGKAQKELQKALDSWRNWVFQDGVSGRLKEKSTQKIKIKEEKNERT